MRAGIRTYRRGCRGDQLKGDDRTFDFGLDEGNTEVVSKS